MPPKKKRSTKPSVAKSAKTKAATTPKKKTTSKKPKKVVAKKRAPKKGVRATTKKAARSSVSVKKSRVKKKVVAKAAMPKPVTTKTIEYKAWPKPVENHQRHHHLALRDFIRAGAFLTMLIGVLAGGYAMTAIAATFEGPTELPPSGNIPVTIWNRQSSGTKQVNAEIDVDGEVQFGDAGLTIGGDGTGRNLIYGVARYYDYDTATYHMDSDDYLLKLQTYYVDETPPGSSYYSTRFSVNRGGGAYSASTVTGNTGLIAGSGTRVLEETTAGQYAIYGAVRYDESDPADYRSHPKDDYLLWLRTQDRDDVGMPWTDRFRVSVSGDVYAAGCFGSTFVGLTVASYAPADVSGYYGAQNKCVADYPNDPGVHVCTSEEMLESIKCSVAADPIRAVADGTAAWINGGPPGFTANANDCQGWTSTAPNAYGRYWIFDLVSGGRGTTTSCNSPGIQFACCR